MKDKFLPILIAGFLLASCSSVYRSGQTPDDVYYSPTRQTARTDDDTKKEEKVEQNTASADDQYLKMKVRNRYRWTSIDDHEYWNDTRYTPCYCPCNGSYTTYHYTTPIRYNTWYTPYTPVLVWGNTRTIRGTTSSSNVKAYTNRTFSNTNSPVNTKTGSANNQGSLLKRVFSSSGTSVDRTERTFGGSSSSGSSTTTSSNAGGKSGGYNSSGSSTRTSRGGRN